MPTPFTYLIGWKNHDKWYYGVRYGKHAHPDTLWTSYFTSSKKVNIFRQKYGEPDVIEIRKIFKAVNHAKIWEEKVLRKLNVVHSDKWLNANVAGRAYIETFSEEHRKKIGAAHKGLKHTEEAKKKQSLAKKGKKLSIEQAKKLHDSRRGVKLTIEHKLKISLANSNRILTDTTKEKMRNAKLGKKQTREHIENAARTRIGNTITKGRNWFHNKNIEIMSKECPGPDWKKGRSQKTIESMKNAG